jgi:hypothetical protein
VTALDLTTDVLVVGGGPAATCDCQTCFQCEANCPADALFVAPVTHPLPDGHAARDEEHLHRTGLLGSYRRHIGWSSGRTPVPLHAVGPQLPAPGDRRPSPPITS